MKEIYILGIGHGTPMFIELAESCGFKVAGLYHYNDTRTGENDHGYPILGSFDDLYNSDVLGKNYVLTMGDMKIKKEVSMRLNQLGAFTPTLIHPTAIISKFSKVSNNGVLICSYSEVHSDSILEDGCVMWPQSIVGHDCMIHKYVFMGPKSYVGAYTEIEENTFIGQCSILISGKAQRVGKNALVGAGSLVTKPVPDGVLAVGSPARIVKHF